MPLCLEGLAERSFTGCGFRIRKIVKYRDGSTSGDINLVVMEIRVEAGAASSLLLQRFMGSTRDDDVLGGCQDKIPLLKWSPPFSLASGGGCSFDD